jgi:hypothetical protein
MVEETEVLGENLLQCRRGERAAAHHLRYDTAFQTSLAAAMRSPMLWCYVVRHFAHIVLSNSFHSTSEMVLLMLSFSHSQPTYCTSNTIVFHSRDAILKSRPGYISSQAKWLLSPKWKSKSFYNWRSVSVSWCQASWPDISLLFFVKVVVLSILGRPLWGEDGSVVCQSVIRSRSLVSIYI